MRVLIVEDFEDSRNALRAMLERLGHEVLEAEGGKEALKVALEGSPNLILMDLSMPGIDGFQATAALRTISPFSNVPIVAITAYPENLSMDEALKAGCNAYLRKPVTLSDLAEILEKFSQ